MRLDDYLKRIDYEGPARPDRASLFELHRAHICAIPFENLDVQMGIPLTTDVAAAFEKIVAKRRGGWCYEQNGLFGWALVQAGFEVTRVAASVMRAGRGDVADDNHLCLIVRTQDSPQHWLADVGFGGSLLEPVALRSGEHEQPPFRLGLRQLGDGHWQFWENTGNGEFSYDFLGQIADEAALSRRCDFLQNDPSSGFVLNLVAQRRAADRHTSLRGRVMTRIDSAGTQRTLLNSADELATTLNDTFGIDAPDAASLWPRVVARHEEFMAERE